MSEAEPYFTTYGELVEGQQWRYNVDAGWQERGGPVSYVAGMCVQALPVPPKPIMVEVEAGLLERLVTDSGCHEVSSTTIDQRNALRATIAAAREASR